ncbi:circularly permuted type 2 ATP-grasp protein [Pseudomonas sp. 102515]|uniref:circularly permuted type 2 ATP-grasp protein n=1 Tax=Pseudomonas sp. 102515 TaxID=3071568 RepID=UPI00280073CF|nr:circularly permuted type 2 ATP-grasp protein [Pseudomonas sp. 102515]MDQ7913148.1 circularly permuted type 2 ATP-grasp protein [Pseudomonas sp. 102515]
MPPNASRNPSDMTGSYHELWSPRGGVRPPWRRFYGHLAGLRLAQLDQRQALIARQIQENGVTYNVYADPKGSDRPWALDLLPQLISAEEWAPLAAGVAQRARLLNRVLGDLYGEQRLLHERLLPPELVFGHNNFLWACQGLRPPGDTWLHVYAVDLARAPDGRWWVLADRTQAPSGAGYALENRHIVARAFPELHRDLQVQPLNGYFQALQRTLSTGLDTGEEAPLAVLLTPGRYNETYFEHLYQARQLGFPLVEGQDLTVRDACLYLKTLSGLRRVHAVFRRLDDDFCDPLELRTDSALGVPGLLEAVRQGNVIMANALGSGLLESPGLLGFLPGVCQALLGETLALPSVATWWCGETPVREAALARLAELVIKPAYPARGFEPVFGKALDAAGLAELRARILATPHAYVAQERIQLSQAPVWQGGSLQSRAIGMRVYAVASEDGYWVMPGGLTRVAHEGAAVVSMQRGGSSKDTWVLGGSRAAAEVPGARVLGVRDLVRKDPFLPSRTAENLFWYGRYSERCEDAARLLRIVLSRYLDADDGGPAVQSAIDLATALEWLPAGGRLAEQLHAALGPGDFPSGLGANLQRLHWAAAQVRGRLSPENWRAIREVEREAHGLGQVGSEPGEALQSLNRLVMALAAVAGFTFDDMTHDESWRFLMIGRRIERVQFLAGSLAHFLEGGATWDAAGLEWLLELGNSIITYRSRYQAAPQLIPVLDLLMLHEHNPYSIRFQLHALINAVEHLERYYGLPRDPALHDAYDRLRRFDLGTLENTLFGDAGRVEVQQGLARLLRQIAEASSQLSERVIYRCFAHVDAVSQRTVSM